MTAEEAAEILRGTCVPVSVDAETQEHRSYEVTPADIAAMVTARERAARVEALRGAARDLDDMAAGWTGDGRTHEVVRLCARTVAARAEEEAGG